MLNLKTHSWVLSVPKLKLPRPLPSNNEKGRTTKRTHPNVAEFVDAVCGCPYSSVGLVLLGVDKKKA
jgi:hypothetical protein